MRFIIFLQAQAGIDSKSLKFCYDRLHSLLLTLEVTDTDEFMHIQTVCNFATLLGTYTRGFSIIIEPYDERMPNIPDPVLQVWSEPSWWTFICVVFLWALRRYECLNIANVGLGILATSYVSSNWIPFGPLLFLSSEILMKGLCFCILVWRTHLR